MQPSGGRDRRGERGNHKTTIQRSYVSSFFDGGLLVLGGFTANYLETCTQVSLHESNTLHSIYEVVGLSRCLEESSTFKTMLFHDDKFAVKVRWFLELTLIRNACSCMFRQFWYWSNAC